MSEPGRVVVIGLGPGGADLVTPAARAALSSTEHRYVRTARHPAVEELARDGLTLESFDDQYEVAGTLDSVYRDIVKAIVELANEHGRVAYAVPGSATVAERTVELLYEAARAGSVRLDVIPGLSFSGLAWARVGVDPMTTGAR